jgi:hypothetical protein
VIHRHARYANRFSNRFLLASLGRQQNDLRTLTLTITNRYRTRTNTLVQFPCLLLGQRRAHGYGGLREARSDKEAHADDSHRRATE